MNTIVIKKCSRCEKDKPVTEYYSHNGVKSTYCKACEKDTIRDYYNNNRKKTISVMTEYRHKARRDAIEHYGGKCACCGETCPEFLAIDHINGGGKKHHKEIKGMALGIWLRKHNYPEGFRVLCHNCNMSLGFFGHCPHGNLH